MKMRSTRSKSLNTDKKLLIIGDATYDSVEYEARLERLASSDSRIVLMGRVIGEELGTVDRSLLRHDPSVTVRRTFNRDS